MGPASPGRRQTRRPGTLEREREGDALTTRHVLTGRVGAQPAPFTDDPELAAASLDRIADIDATWVLSGHGSPWHGSPAAIAAAVRGSAPG